MAIRKFIVVPVTGTATAVAYSPYLSGYIESIEYVKAGVDPYADGVDFTITADETGEAILSLTDQNSSVVKRPRAATHSTAGVAAVYASGGTPVNDRIALSRDRVKIAIAQGGNGKTGTFIITVDDGR
ncbi:MAG: hypothetical protein M9944_07995 [Rhizobiaceae bacterium]|nr:hypothetical protein [Rhizobiaceae bacterium]